MSKPKLHIGIIGAGRIGAVHAETLAFRLPEAKALIIADINRPAAEEVATRYGIPRVTESAEEVLADPEIEAVLICSSTDTHADLIVAAAGAGKHIFCEKPIDHRLEKIDRALAAVKRFGVQLQIGFNRRFDPNFLKVREIVKSGGIGEPHVLKITSRDPSPPPEAYIRASGGIFLDMTIHDFDMARYLMGSDVTEVYARATVLVDPVFEKAGDWDTAVVTLTFANGALGTIDNSRKAVYGYDQRVEVFGSEGMVTVANNAPDSHICLDRTGTHSSLPLNFFMERYTESYLREMQAFVDSVRENKPVPVTGNDCLMAVAIGLAAAKSVKENRSVKLSEIH
ncbi:MAG: inositol 2-dehydrogenase [Terriglobia bacterium]|jgi:myo-inositol 2-dehydrogenase/D-chiro-inositol 1-dehydrogenase